MTTSDQELATLLRSAYDLPRGPGRWAALDTVFRHADHAGKTQFAFDARLAAVQEFHYGGDPTRAFAAFSWCLAAFDATPDVAHHGQMHTMLWRFKWIVWALPQFPEIPLDRTLAVLDDMQRRYQHSGHSLHAVYQHRWLVAHHRGDLAAAAHWYDQMLTARRDGLSDCQACVPSSQVRHLASLGRLAEAVEVGAPYARGGCDEQPHWILSELLLPYTMLGRYDDAVEAHREAYRRMRDNRHHLDNIAQHVLFCGVTSNETRGLELIERHLPWLERPSTPFAVLEFASAAARVLDGLCQQGSGAVEVHRRTEDGTRTWTSTVAELHGELSGLARELAQRFDARNANTYQSERVEARMSLPAVVTHLPLTALDRRTGSVTTAATEAVAGLVEQLTALERAGDRVGAARTRVTIASVLRNASQWADAAEAAEEAMRHLEGADPSGELGDDLARCRYLLWQLYRRAPHYSNDALHNIDELLTTGPVSSAVPSRAALLEESVGLLRGRDGVTRLLEAAAQHRASERPDEELRVLGLVLRRAPQAQTVELLLGAVARWRELGASAGAGAAEVAHTDLVESRLLAAAGRNEEVLPIAGRAAQVFASLDQQADLLNALLLQASAHAACDRPEEAERIAREVIGQDSRRHFWWAAKVLTGALRRQGRHQDLADFLAEHQLNADEFDDDDSADGDA